MQKILSIFIAFCLLFISVAPIADASVRIRRNQYIETTPTYNQYYQTQTYQNPYYQTPYYQPPAQVYKSSIGSTYYYSPTYIAGYTYYSTPTPGYYYYSDIPSTSTTSTSTSIQQGSYYYSANYVAGYTYYSTPTPGYYNYLGTTVVSNNNYNYNTSYYNNGNRICTVVNGVYQCNNNSYAPVSGTYPGCSTADIIIGGQAWASCNALDRNAGSTSKSGWFFAGDRESSFVSFNASTAALEWMGKQTRDNSSYSGPCAAGYRVPNRGEWETLQVYARANGTTVANMISLNQNGAYQGTRNTNGDISITGRLSVAAAYWTSSIESGNPIVMHIASGYSPYGSTTNYGYVSNGYQWTYTDGGLQLLSSTTGELANVRCIR